MPLLQVAVWSYGDGAERLPFARNWGALFRRAPRGRAGMSEKSPEMPQVLGAGLQPGRGGGGELEIVAAPWEVASWSTWISGPPDARTVIR